MDRLTRPEVRVDQTAGRLIGNEVKIDVFGDKMLHLILNGPTINSVNKDTLRHLVRQLYAALQRYEDTGLTQEKYEAMKLELEKVNAERDEVIADIRAFAEDVAHQFGYHTQYNGRLTLTHGGLSTLEWAFDILGWENPHPDPENECQYAGCHHYASCGTPTKDGYLRVCGHHFAVIRNGVEAALSIKSATDTNVGSKEEA